MKPGEQNYRLYIATMQILASKTALQNRFPAGYVNDPAVTILLSLFAYHLKGVVITDTELAAIADYLPDIAIRRWLQVFRDDDLIAIGDTTQGEAAVMLTDRGVVLLRETIIDAGAAEKRVRDDMPIDLAGPA